MRIVAILSLLILAGCAAVNPKYTIPRDRGYLSNNVFEINKSSDEVWTSLVEYVPRKFFSIKDSDKNAGVLTLSFGSSRPEKYVDCGEINVDESKNKKSFLDVAKTTGTVELLGTVNLLVKSIDDGKTSVTVSTGYILNIKEGSSSTQTWDFNANGKQSRKMGELKITCRPTVYAENDIIAGINFITRGH